MKNKFKFFLFLFPLITIFISDVAAQLQLQDVVYLKNGGIIHGIIIEQVPGQSIKIQTHEQNIFSYKMEEIEKFEKEIVNTKKKFTNKDEIKQNPHSGFSFTLSGSMGSGSGSYNSGKGVIANHVML